MLHTLLVRLGAYAVWMVFPQFFYAQSDTILKETYLPEVSIIEQKWKLSSIGHEILMLDSLKQTIFFNQRASEWLQMEGLVFIKSYGIGQLNTISYRGNTANQNQVLWNGVPIQSPFNASADYSQIPITQGNIRFLRGTNPALWGSGAGSSLLLSPLWIFPYQVQVYQQIGSFGLNQQHFFLQPKLKNQTLQVQAYKLFSNNNFTYFNREKPNAPQETLEHAQTRNLGTQLDYKLVHKYHLWEAHLWFHDAQTQIPPVLTSDTSAQNQKDQNLRLQLVYQTYFQKLKFSSQQSYLRDYLWYEDSIAQIFSGYLSHQWYSDHYLQYQNERNFFQVQLQNHGIFPSAGDVMELPKIWQRHALLGSYQYETLNKKWKHGLNFRYEYIQNQWINPIINFSFERNIFVNGFIKGNLGNTYRYPSLNDLYWKVGGNPYLKPEKGWVYEFSLGYRKKMNYLQATYYAGHYQNLIIWLPDGGIWKAQNMNEIYSNGVEFSGNTGFFVGKHQFLWNFSGFYGQSILTKERFENDEAYRKQLIYQPKYRYNLQISWLYKSFYWHYQQVWNGYVYYTSDNSEWLPDFWIGSIVMGYQWKWAKHSAQIQLQIKNVWDKEYVVIKNRPMPGRNYVLGLQWNY